ncbi:MAG: DUF4163 domain-containing protein [Sphingomonadaceae bacterium]
MARFLAPLLASTALLLPGCTSAGAPVQSAASQPAPVSGTEVEEETDAYSFSYSYPGEANAIPALRAHMERDMEAANAEIVKQAAEAKADAEANDYPFRPHYLAIGWGVAGDTSGWLSMSASIETYSGGAHGNHGFDTLLWDKRANVRREVTNLFISEAALRDAIRERFCAGLDAERAERRGEPVRRSDEWPDDCIDPFEAEVLLESEGGQVFETLTVLIAPYLAGSYAEGSYLVSVPVDARVLAAVKPEYRKAFAGG